MRIHDISSPLMAADRLASKAVDGSISDGSRAG